MRRSFAWLFAAALLPATGWADGLYRVEIIIFAQPSASIEPVQHFESTPNMSLDQMVDFRKDFCIPAQIGPSFLRHFRSEEEIEDCLNGYLRLNELREPMVAERLRLEKSGQYRILHHAAWQQPVTNPDEAHPVRLTDGRDIAQASPEAPVLDGSVLLSKEQFLQLDIKLLYHYPASAPNGTPATSDGLLLQINRKLRPGDLNYMDHPAIGVLAQVTPVEEDPLSSKEERNTRVVRATR